jgi:hypothetical protein
VVARETGDHPAVHLRRPPGSPCRTGKNKVAIQYHTARFRLAPQLAKALSVPTPAIHKPKPVWTEFITAGQRLNRWTFREMCGDA